MHGRAVSIAVAISIFALALLSGGPAAAQSPAPDALAAARELVTASRAAEQLKPAIVQGRPEIARDFDAIIPQLIEAANARSEAFVEGTTAVYARNFTADELRQLAAFYRSEIGQKFLEKMPVVAQESMAMGQKFGQEIAGELHDRMIEELRKRGHNL